MKSGFKNISWPILVLLTLIGISLGAGGTFVLLRSYDKYAISALTDYELSELENKAASAFHGLSADASIYAQENLISYVKLRKEIGWINGDAANGMLGLAKLRLAATLASINKKEEATIYYNQALDDLTKSNSKFKNRETIDQLMKEMQKERSTAVKRPK